MIRSSSSSKALLYAVEVGYKISKQGTVTNPKGKILTGYLNNSGYKVHSVHIDGKHWKFSAHALQAYTKFGDIIFETECIRHLDDNKENNSFDNIDVGSNADNFQDSIKNGREGLVTEESLQAAVQATRKLNDEQCKEVYIHLQNGGTQKDLCERFGLSKSTMSCILRSDYYNAAIKTNK